MKRVLLSISLLLLASCASPDDTDPVDVVADPRLADELPIGDTNEPGSGKDDDFRHNGEEDFSETCKVLPDVEALADPEIVISVDGRTIHLWDNDGDYDRVFSVGLGKIGASGESLTPLSDGNWVARADERPLIDSPTSDRRKWAWNYSCRHWSGTTYFNPASGEKEFRSYFAGLPFIRFEGPERAVYGMHGPIDNYWREDGGELYRGYVSGGCSRMDPDDLGEVFGRIAGHAAPVTIQREIEFDAEGLSIDSDRFMGAHCLRDSDCADDGAICATPSAGGASFCTAPCEASTDCPIRENEIIGSIGVLSFCVDDSGGLAGSTGYCAVEGNNKTNHDCRSYPADLIKRRLPVVEDAERLVTVCAAE